MDFRPTQHTPTQAHTESNTAVPATKRRGKKGIPNLSKQLVLWLVVILLLIAAGATAAFFMHKYNESQKQVDKLASNPTVTAQQEQQDLITKVGKLTILPSGETPTIATVTDITKLADQPFFTAAKNGDKVLIYTQAKKAYLYRPSTNKLINIAPVNLGNNTGTTNSTTQNSTATKK